jgi:outer membrane autotransporter protein
MGKVTLTPFTQLAGVTQATSAFTETGGQGQLTTAAQTNSALFVTLGVGAETSFVLGNDMLVTAHGSIGWRHAFAAAPVASNSFVGGGPFSVTGTGPATDAAVLSAGLRFDISETLGADLSYDGMIGSGGSSHAVKLTLAGKF